MSAGTLTIVAIAWIASALIAGAVATGRGRDGAVWMAIGLILGPLAILPPAIFSPPGSDT